MIVQTWAAVLVAFTVSAMLPFALKPMLRKFSVVDVPNERSSHADLVLRGGGSAQLAGVSIGVTIVAVDAGIGSDSKDLVRFLVILAVLIAIGVLGLIEDLRGVAIYLRAFVQLVIGGVASGLLVAAAGAPPWWAIFAAIFFTGYTNAANFMDGIDTISAMHGLTVGGVLATIGCFSRLPWLISVGLILAVAFAAFLPWNVGPGRLFLGDVGSYLLGGGIAIVCIAAAVSGVAFVSLLGPLSIYLADTGMTLLRRIARGERWQDAHRSHVYQRLVVAGLSHVQVSLIVSAGTVISAAFGLFGLSGSLGGSLIAVLGIGLTASLYIAVPFLIGRSQGYQMKNLESRLK